MYTNDDNFYDDDFPCDNCSMSDFCDGWEANFCCELCNYLGGGNCDEVWKTVLKHQTYQENYLSPPEVDICLDLADLDKLLYDMKGSSEKGVLEQIAEEQKTLLDTTKAWSKALEHGDIY